LPSKIASTLQDSAYVRPGDWFRWQPIDIDAFLWQTTRMGPTQVKERVDGAISDTRDVQDVLRPSPSLNVEDKSTRVFLGQFPCAGDDNTSVTHLLSTE
jgi:hypothetical protein